MRGMREHIEKLNAFNAVARQAGDIFCHGLRIAAGVDDVIRCHLAQVIAQRFSNAATWRINQDQVRHFSFAGGKTGGVQRLKFNVSQPQPRGGLFCTRDGFGTDFDPGQRSSRAGQLSPD